MSNSDEFMELLHEVNEAVPGSWNPRREQPEYDRMFNGRAEINQHFSNGTDKATTWLRECTAFSTVIKDGFEGGGGGDSRDLSTFARDARQYLSLGKNQGLNDDE
jgi:hypothetical protein